MRIACGLLFLALSLCQTAFAHDDAFSMERDAGWTAAERKAGHELPLAMSAVRQLARINAGLQELAERDAGACRWMNQITGPETLAQQVRAFDGNASIKTVIEAQMSVRDYLLTLHAVSESAITVHAAAHGIDVDVAASASNVAFYRQHRAEIERLLDEPDPC
ncbi:MAG: hypothetical protein ABW106_08580 [Steroidobacteraceae bacterium]